MRQGIYQASHRIGLVTALLCLLAFLSLLFAEPRATHPGGYLILGVFLPLVVYCAIRLAGWAIHAFFAADRHQ